jgi:hypothetical protein
MRALIIAAAVIALAACSGDNTDRTSLATAHQNAIEGRDATMAAAQRAAAAAERAEAAAMRAEQAVNRMEQGYQQSLRK